MGKKKTNQHAVESFGNMVHKAALNNLLPDIENVVRFYVNNLASKLASDQITSLASLYTRLNVIEDILIKKLGYTKEDIRNKYEDIEDSKAGLIPKESGIAEAGDTVRIDLEVKPKEQETFLAPTKLKIENLGSGLVFDKDLESEIIGMKSGETKEIKAGPDKSAIAKVTIKRISTLKDKPKVKETEKAEVPNEEQTQG